jgi:quinol monooxygenase YgiN
MLARVTTFARPGGIDSATLDFAQQGLNETRKQEGCEGVWAVADSATGETIAVVLFRDQAALDASRALQARFLEAAPTMGITVGEAKVYDTVVIGT